VLANEKHNAGCGLGSMTASFHNNDIADAACGFANPDRVANAIYGI
jgi:hypothetical protein